MNVSINTKAEKKTGICEYINNYIYNEWIIEYNACKKRMKENEHKLKQSVDQPWNFVNPLTRRCSMLVLGQEKRYQKEYARILALNHAWEKVKSGQYSTWEHFPVGNSRCELISGSRVWFRLIERRKYDNYPAAIKIRPSFDCFSRFFIVFRWTDILK